MNSKMFRSVPLLFLLVVLLADFSASSLAAKDGDVVRRKAFPGGGVAKLKAGPENGRIEIEYELDDVRPRALFRLVVRQNGRVILNQRKRSSALGKVRFRRLAANLPGSDTFATRSSRVGQRGVCSISLVYRR